MARYGGKLGAGTGPSLLEEYKKHFDLVILFFPCLIYFIIFYYVPMYGVSIAFQNFGLGDGYFGSPWVGLENFHNLFTMSNFLPALRNTIVISLLRMLFGFFAPILLALLINELRITWYKRLVQSITYLPYFFSWVILGGLVFMFFSISGPVNQLLSILNIKPVQFMTDPSWFIFVLILTGIWQTAGYGSVIYLAALSGIEVQLYEAAMVDGAGRWKQTIHITIPELTPTIVTLFILGVGGILNAGFDQIYNLYSPMVYSVSDIIDTYVLRALQNMDFSLGAAAGLFKAAVGLIMILITNWFAKKVSGGELGIL